MGLFSKLFRRDKAEPSTMVRREIPTERVLEETDYYIVFELTYKNRVAVFRIPKQSAFGGAVSGRSAAQQT